MSEDTDQVRVDPDSAEGVAHERGMRELALREFHASLPIRGATPDPIEDFVVAHEQRFRHLSDASETARALSKKHGCEVPSSMIQDAVNAHYAEESRQIEPRLYDRARQHNQLDRWISEVEDIQALLQEFDRLHRFRLWEERGERFDRILNGLLTLNKRIPAELDRLRRLGASIPPLRPEPRITTGLQKRLVGALTGKIVPAVFLAETLGITTTQLRSLISRLNRPDKFILNERGEGYYLRDHPPANREDLKRM